MRRPPAPRPHADYKGSISLTETESTRLGARRSAPASQRASWRVSILAGERQRGLQPHTVPLRRVTPVCYKGARRACSSGVQNGKVRAGVVGPGREPVASSLGTARGARNAPGPQRARGSVPPGPSSLLLALQTHSLWPVPFLEARKFMIYSKEVAGRGAEETPTGPQLCPSHTLGRERFTRHPCLTAQGSLSQLWSPFLPACADPQNDLTNPV